MNKRLMLAAALIGSVVVTAALTGCVPATNTQTQAEGASSIYPLIIFLVLIFGMFYLLIIRPQRKRQKEAQSLLADLKKGDKVLTAGGIYGTIEAIAEDSFVVRIESGATMRVAKGSVIGKRS